jgi:DNA-binding response OmpR family regulator
MSGGASRQITVLVVDDEPRLRRLVRQILEAAGFAVLEAGGGQQAVEAVAERRPDLVLLDVLMPGLDGMEACRRIRAFSDVPVVMVTALADEAALVRGLGLGADEYLTKPFRPRALLAHVRAVLRRAPPRS